MKMGRGVDSHVNDSQWSLRRAYKQCKGKVQLGNPKNGRCRLREW